MGLRKEIRKTKQNLADWLKAEYYRYIKDIRCVDWPKKGLVAASRICILAHYSPDGVFDEYLYHYVRALIAADCNVLVVSTSPAFRQSDKAALLEMGVGVVHRHNVGYDFGSWYAGVKLIAPSLHQYETVLFANDSVYGPFSDLAEVFSKMSARDLDVWSMTVSLERKPHFQTFFWAVANKGLHGVFFRRFWFQDYQYFSLRQRVIDQYELRLKEVAENQYGLKTGSYIDPGFLSAQAAKDFRPDKLNPVQHGALLLLKEHDFPFVKRELLLSDPLAVKAGDAIGEVLANKNADLWDATKKHLEKLRLMKF